MPVGAVRITTTKFAEEGYNTVFWTATHAADHYAYRVYRRAADLRTPWVLVAQRTDIADSYTVRDNHSPAGQQFYTVVEVHGTSVTSTQTEDNKLDKDVLVDLETPYYWLVHPTDNAQTIQLRGVTSDEFTNERVIEVKHLIGRGRKIDVGDDLGKTGSISGRIFDRPDRTAREIRLDIEDAKDLDSHWFLRNPFGDYWKIWWTDPQFSRLAGTGRSEYVDISFEYYEVA